MRVVLDLERALCSSPREAISWQRTQNPSVRRVIQSRLLADSFNPNRRVQCRLADPDRVHNRSRALTPHHRLLRRFLPLHAHRRFRVVNDLDARQQRLHETPVVNLVFVRDRVRVGPVADAELKAPARPGARQLDRQFRPPSLAVRRRRGIPAPCCAGARFLGAFRPSTRAGAGRPSSPRRR